jgi:hypothetical protein
VGIVLEKLPKLTTNVTLTQLRRAGPLKICRTNRILEIWWVS